MSREAVMSSINTYRSGLRCQRLPSRLLGALVFTLSPFSATFLIVVVVVRMASFVVGIGITTIGGGSRQLSNHLALGAIAEAVVKASVGIEVIVVVDERALVKAVQSSRARRLHWRLGKGARGHCENRRVGCGTGLGGGSGGI